MRHITPKPGNGYFWFCFASWFSLGVHWLLPVAAAVLWVLERYFWVRENDNWLRENHPELYEDENDDWLRANDPEYCEDES